MKKILSVALAFIMVFSCFLLTTSAVQSDAAIAISVEPIAGEYKKGDVVTFEVFYEGSEYITMIAQPCIIAFGYDSRVFEPVQDCPTPTMLTSITKPTFIYAGYELEKAQVSDGNTSVLIGKGATAVDTAKGWDSWIMFKVTSQDICQDYSTKKASFAFNLKIKEDADFANGSLKVGISDYKATTEYTCLNAYYLDEIMLIDGQYTAEDYGFECAMYSYTDGTVKVAGATEASFIKDGGAQIRFRGIGSTGTVADYQGEFDVRTVATISQDDFVAKFGTDENAIAKITDIGFVYATAANVPTFDLATAKAVAEGTASEGYVKKAVQSIQHAGDGEVYKFTCLIENIADADKEQTVNALAYVCFDGTYYYFDAAATVDFATLYERMPK